MDPETQNPSIENKGGQLWTASNVFSVLAMGIGSIGYGYSANVIAPILGKPPTESINAVLLTGVVAFPGFNEYFGLETRSDGTAILAAMTVCCSRSKFVNVSLCLR